MAEINPNPSSPTMSSPNITSPNPKSPFSERYFENSLGEILPKYSNSLLRLTQTQIESLSSYLGIDPTNKTKQTLIKEILFKILLSEDYSNRYGLFNSDFETQCYLKQEVFRRTIFVKHRDEIRAQLEKEKAEIPTAEDLIRERKRIEKLIQEGSLISPFEEFDEEAYTRRVLENVNIIPPGASVLALPAPSKTPKPPLKSTSPKSPYEAKSWAKEAD